MRLLKISALKWYQLISGLRKRGGGVRESGAFLLSKIGSDRICKIIFYDELDPEVSASGIIRFNGSGYIKLWPLLRNWGMEVVADIHTHPDSNTNQSFADKSHPMIRLKGHIALIAPFYAMYRWINPNVCSAYLYEGSFQWRSLDQNFPIKTTWL
ncbi:MAG: hypothetical protein KDC79_08530 [Cyclobacteriaceae bacterium]|nr:hypothetical protein [Cyclobacteriaceae bacterium]